MLELVTLLLLKKYTVISVFYPAYYFLDIAREELENKKGILSLICGVEYSVFDKSMDQ